MTEKLMEILEHKTRLDAEFNVMLIKLTFLIEQGFFEKDKKDEGENWLNMAMSDYEKVKDEGCCNQE